MISDVPPKLPDNPTRFMDQLRALIRSRNLAYKTAALAHSLYS